MLNTALPLHRGAATASPSSSPVALPGSTVQALSDREFAQFQRFIFERAGITLAPSKKALVSGRLTRRVAHHGLASFGDYIDLLASPGRADEVQIAVDHLTTNETYFFREAQHFDFLRRQALAWRERGCARPLRVWSAASSSGEEAYSIAMVLADCLDSAPWEVLGTDISTKVLQDAVRGLYPMSRGRHLPRACLERWCLKGTGEHEGHFLIDRSLRARVRFGQVNLNTPLPDVGRFDVIFLRNVMIYFSDETKRQVIARVISALHEGGHFLIGHSESLNGLTDAVTSVAPSVYRKPA
jgi:chemotaxis protein methyltransferase CheR